MPPKSKVNVNNVINLIEDDKVKKEVIDLTKEPISVKQTKDDDEVEFVDVLKNINIDEFYTKADSRQTKYNKFIVGVVPEENYNYMCDLLELPTTKVGYKWLFVCVDLATSLFDMEPMKNKTAHSTLVAFKNMIKRKILKLPEISIQSDGGTEFKGEFNKYFTDNKILHITKMAYRKTQLSVVEALNKSIARILMNYMNDKAIETNKDYKEWTDILQDIRIQLNKFRKRNLVKLKKYQDKKFFDTDEEPKFKEGDMVHYKLMRPQHINGDDIGDSHFREGDRRFSLESREIVKIQYYPTEPFFRYKLLDMPKVTYSEHELKLSKDKANTFIVRKIIGTKIYQKKRYYLVWWKGKLKSESTYELEDDLIEDGLEEYINEFKKNSRLKKKK